MNSVGSGSAPFTGFRKRALMNGSNLEITNSKKNNTLAATPGHLAGSALFFVIRSEFARQYQKKSVSGIQRQHELHMPEKNFSGSCILPHFLWKSVQNSLIFCAKHKPLTASWFIPTFIPIFIVIVEYMQNTVNELIWNKSFKFRSKALFDVKQTLYYSILFTIL